MILKYGMNKFETEAVCLKKRQFAFRCCVFVMFSVDMLRGNFQHFYTTCLYLKKLGHIQSIESIHHTVSNTPYTIPRLPLVLHGS